MGYFGNSFKRELGKNAAKRVSNAIFGDKWSTPYKRVESRRGPSPETIVAREQYAEIQRDRNELKRRQIEIAEAKNRAKEAAIRHQIEMAEAKNREREREIEDQRRRQDQITLAEVGIRQAEVDRLQTGQMWELDSAVIKNVDAVIAIPIPIEERELENLTLRLSNQMATEHWCTVDCNGTKSPEGAIRDKYVNALFFKFSACLTTLKNLFPRNPSITYLSEQKFEYEKNQRKAQLWPLRNNENLATAITVPEDAILIEKLLDELRIHYTSPSQTAVRAKYEEVLNALEKANPDSPRISNFRSYNKKLIWRERWSKNKKTIMWVVGVMIALYLFGLLLQFEGKGTDVSIGIFITTIFYIVVAIVAIIIPISSWYLRKRRLDSYRKANNR